METSAYLVQDRDVGRHVIKQQTKPTGQRHSIFYFTYALLFRYSESTCLLFFCLEMSKQLTLFGTSAKDNKRAGNLINKDPKSKYEKFIERFVRRNKAQAPRESVVRSPQEKWKRN